MSRKSKTQNRKLNHHQVSNLEKVWMLRGFSTLVILIAMILFAVPVEAVPSLNFVSPTPANNTYISTNYTEINITITEPNLDTFLFSWNNTNYSFYDSSLVLAMNFNNILR